MSYHEGETTTVRACCMFRQNFDYVYKQTTILVRPSVINPSTGLYIPAVSRIRWETNFKYDEEVKCEFDCKEKDEMEVDEDTKSGARNDFDPQAGDPTKVVTYTIKWEKVTKAGRCNSKNVQNPIGKGCECHIDKSESGHGEPGGGTGPDKNIVAWILKHEAAVDAGITEYGEADRGEPMSPKQIEFTLKSILKKMKKKECKDLTTTQKNRCCSGKKPEQEWRDFDRVPPPSTGMITPTPNLTFGR